MRALLALLAAPLFLSGCFGGEDAPPSAAPSNDTAGAGRAEAGQTGLDAPVLPAGRAWTYAATQQYDPEPEITIVVAPGVTGGYLFAGGEPEDLYYPALWGSHWFGPHDADLNHPNWRAFDWPLVDGKSWAYSETLTVTARAAEVATPSGREAGFVMEGANERTSLRYEYAPSVGYFVRFEQTVRGELLDRLELVRVEDDRPGVWFELGPLVVVPAAESPQAFEVPEGWDEVIASVGGAGGTRARIVSPSGDAREAEMAGEESWRHLVFPATPGRWAAAIEAPPTPLAEIAPGWAYVHVAPVRWT